MKKYTLSLAGVLAVLTFTLQAQTYVWAKQINGGTQGQSVKTDALGNVYTCGIFNAPTDFDPGPGVVTLANYGGVLYDSYVCKYTSAGNLVWAKQIGGNGTDYCYELVLDASNNVYVAGRFDGTADFDPGPGSASITSNGNSDAYVVKLDLNGNYVWARNMGGSALDEGHAISLDAAGNVLTSGMFAGTADFDPGPGSYTLNTGGAAYDPFICKLDANGNFIWARQLAGPGSDTGYGIMCDASNNVYSVGTFAGIIDMDPGAGTYTINNGGTGAGFVSKLDASGIFVWGGAILQGSKVLTEVDVDPAGNIVLSGRFSNTPDFDPGAGTFTMTQLAGADDIFVTKWDANMNFLWAKQMGGPGADYNYDMDVDGSGNVLTTGYFNSAGPADFDPGPGVYNMTALGTNDAYLSKLDANGNFLSANQVGSTAGDAAYCCHMDGSGNLYAGGNFNGTVDFDPGAGVQNLTGPAGFILKWFSCSPPSQPGAISGLSSLCANNGSTTYSVAPVGGATSYAWTFPGGWTGTSTTNVISASPGTSGIISVSASNGCSSPAQTMAVTVYANPVISVNSGSICNGQSFTMVPNGASTYTFVPAGPVVSPVTNTTYSVIGTSSAGCVSSNTAVSNVTVNNIPATPGSISGPATICSGSVGNYSVTVVAGATSYAWTLPGGWSGSSVTNIINATAGVTSGNISVTANNACGSSGAQTISVTVNTPPSTPGPISGNNVICAGSSNTYSVAAVGGATSYSWTKPGGWTGVSTTNVINTTASSTSGNVSVIAINACGNSAAQNLSVTVNPNPVITVNSGSICNGQSFTMVPGGASTYTFIPSGPVVNPVANATYSVIGTSSAGCVGSNTAISNVTVNNIPAQPGLIAGPTPICAGSVGNYSVAPVPGASGYSWLLPAGWSGSSSSNIINATAGVNSGIISITANNSCGTSPARTLAVTVNSVPATPGAISGNIVICSGSSNTYSIAPVAGATSYSWTKPGGWTGVSTTNVINTTASSTSGFVTVIAINACGSSAAQNLSVTVNTPPATPGAISGANVLCSGTSANYSVAPVGGATSYIWTLPAGWSGSSSTNTINGISGNSGNVSVIASNSCGNSAAQNLFVTVNTTPTVTIAGGTSTICSGAVVTLTASGAVNYTWLPVGAFTSTVAVSPGVTSTYTVFGASGTCNGLAVKTITVNPTPTVTANASSANICSGSTVVLTGGGANNYTWSGGVTDGVSFSPAVTSNYTVTGTTLAGCSSTAAITVTVTNIPATPSSVSGPTAICAGGPAATYSINPVPGATSYIWTLPAGWSGTSSTTSISAAPGLNGGNIVVYASNFCGSSSPQNLSVTINPAPSLSVNGTPMSVCAGANVTLSASGASSYSWNTGAITATAAINPTATTIYTLTGSAAGCSSFTTITIGVFGNPTLNPVSSTSVLCSGQSATLTASGANTYTWYPSGSGATIVVSPTINTTYTVSGTNGSGCTATYVFTQSVAICAGLSATALTGNDLLIYPNPTSDILNIDAPHAGSLLQIFNAMGELMLYETLTTDHSTFSIHHLANGIYFVRVGSVNQKIIKE